MKEVMGQYLWVSIPWVGDNAIEAWYAKGIDF